MLGIEINPYAAELARVTIWIGELQWQLRKGGKLTRRPILGQLKGIECRDALVGADGREAKWPKADAIIGNPPFLGGKRLKTNLGDDYVEALFALYDNRVPAEADLVIYWFRKAGEALGRNKGGHAGFVATNSIRGGANRRVLQALRVDHTIYEAWDDEKWVIDGAAVRVSLVAFAPSSAVPAHTPKPHLDGESVEEIFADLTPRRAASGVDLTQAKRLKENLGVCFMGDTKGGAFDIPGDLARQWLRAPLNPNGRPNSDVLRPWVNGMDVTRRPRDMWIIDFGWEMTEEEAALYELPFTWCSQNVETERSSNNREHYRSFWWRHMEPRPGLLSALSNRRRYIVTPRVAKHRLFVWIESPVLPDSATIAAARDDDTAFGILTSHAHETWTLRMCSWLGVGNDPRYTPSTTFETFPFPDRLTPDTPLARSARDSRGKKIAAAARRLDELRNAWLNPSNLVRHEPEVVPGYPDRVLAVDARAAKELAKRTLTNLYNERPRWLADAHRALDEAVAAAYGWPTDLSDDDILARLLALNLERAAAQ